MKKKKQQSRPDPAIAIAKVLEEAGVPVSEATGLALVELGACIATLTGTSLDWLRVKLATGVDRGRKQIVSLAMTMHGITPVGGHAASSKRKGSRKI